jgi:hypothetical protein
VSEGITARTFCEELSTPLRFGGWLPPRRRAEWRARIIQAVTSPKDGKFVAQRGFTRSQIAQRSLLALLILLAVAYAADSAVFRYRLSTNHQPFGSVTISHYDAVLQKDGRSELIFDPPAQQTCVNSLFPHAGFPPCWYLNRNAERRTDI